MSQSERIFYIDRKLRSGAIVTTNAVAEHFEVSTRQVKRDIEYLRDRFSAPIIYDSASKSYKYETQFDALKFADQKMVLFYVALKSLTESEHYIPIYSEEMITNLKNDVPRDYREVCDKIMYMLPKQGSINSEYFLDICDALRDRKCLKISYTNINNEKSDQRIIEPERLVSYDGSWYIVCYDQKHSDIRTFHISRIASLEKTKIDFHNSDKEYQEMLNKFLSESYGIFKGKKNTTAKIRFTGRAEKTIQSLTLHPKQKIEVYDGYTELTLPVATFTEIIAQTLSFGAEAKPVSPPELVEQWKSEVKKLAELI